MRSVCPQTVSYGRDVLFADAAFGLQAEGIDADAAQYLKQVREEASRIPHVTVSKCRAPPRATSPSATALDAAATEPEAPQLPLPLIDWTYGVIHGFIEARRQVEYAV